MAIIQNSKNMAINPMEIYRIPKKEDNHIIEKKDILRILEEHKQELIEQMNQIVKQEKSEENYKISMSLDEDENFIRIILNWMNWNELQYAIGNPNINSAFHNELLKTLVDQIREIIQREFPSNLMKQEEEMSI